MSTGSSIKATVKHVRLFLEINIRPNSAVIGAATQEWKKHSLLTTASDSVHTPIHTVCLYLFNSPLSSFLHLHFY